jgi:hypothetical protein
VTWLYHDREPGCARNFERFRAVSAADGLRHRQSGPRGLLDQRDLVEAALDNLSRGQPDHDMRFDHVSMF